MFVGQSYYFRAVILEIVYRLIVGKEEVAVAESRQRRCVGGNQFSAAEIEVVRNNFHFVVGNVYGRSYERFAAEIEFEANVFVICQQPAAYVVVDEDKTAVVAVIVAHRIAKRFEVVSLFCRVFGNKREGRCYLVSPLIYHKMAAADSVERRVRVAVFAQYALKVV